MIPLFFLYFILELPLKCSLHGCMRQHEHGSAVLPVQLHHLRVEPRYRPQVALLLSAAAVQHHVEALVTEPGAEFTHRLRKTIIHIWGAQQQYRGPSANLNRKKRRADGITAGPFQYECISFQIELTFYNSTTTPSPHPFCKIHKTEFIPPIGRC